MPLSPATNAAAIESRLRRAAHRHGCIVRKSRVRNPHLNDLGGYALIDASHNVVIAGSSFELTLADVEALLASWDPVG